MKLEPILLFVVLLCSCVPVQPLSDQNISFSTLMQGIHSQTQFERGETVFRDRLAWNKLQQQLVSQVAPYPPNIDFDKEMIIAVFYGEATSGGYKVDIDQLTETVDDVLVHIREEVPGEGCFTTEVLTYPYHVIRMNRTEKKLVFVRESVRFACY